MDTDDYAAAAEGRLGSDRMALGLAIIPDKNRGDMDIVAQLRAQLAAEREARKALYEAADVFAAGQSRAPNPSCGLVQPVTVEDCERLNAALALAAKLP